jgi:hypothetical protein
MDSQECTLCRLNPLAAQSSVETITFFTLLYKAKYTLWHASRKSSHLFDGYGLSTGERKNSCKVVEIAPA